jgi:homoserine O-acetyltransferase
MNERRDLWWPSPTGEFGKVVGLELERPFQTAHGAELRSIQFAYESWGDPSSREVVLIVHPLTTDCHVTGEFQGEPPGWWEILIGPDRALDTRRCYVLCPNLLGGCYGTTGPRFPDPDGRPYLERFPLLTPRDQMRAQRLFLEALGISRVSLVIGPSMGGMIAWEWAIEGGELVDRVAVVAAPLSTTPLQIGWNWIQRQGLELDLESEHAAAKGGQILARAVGMLSYRSPEGLLEKFGRSWFEPPGASLKNCGVFNIESWLRQHGRRIAKRFDPWTYLLLSRVMDLHDVSAGRESLEAALAAVRAEVLVIGISSDCLYPCAQVREGAEMLRRTGGRVRYEEIVSPHGHDGFLLETTQLEEILRRFSNR